MNARPRSLILATSYAPELRRPEKRPPEYPRTDYVELAGLLESDILDYSTYDDGSGQPFYRKFEKKVRLDFHLAISGYRRARGYDTVVLMSERVAIPYMMLQRASGKRAATVFVSAHSSSRQANLVRSMKLFSGLDAAVSNTHAQSAFMVNEMQIPMNRIHYVLYTVDESFYTPGEGGDYVFSAGGVGGRDYATLFEAVADMPFRVKVAAGGRGDGLKSRGDIPPPTDNVELMEPMNNAAMRAMYREAAVVVVPLKSDRKDAAGCSVVLEGLCCGRPTVASHTAGMEDYIVNYRSGLLVEPANPPALRACIMQMYSDRETAQSLGRSGRAEAEGRLSLSRLVNGLQETVLEVS